jgi:hypothetical protein
MSLFDVRHCYLPLLFAVCFGCSGVTGQPGGNTGPVGVTENPVPVAGSSVGPLAGTWSGPVQVTGAPAGQTAITVTTTLNHTINNGQSTITGGLTVAGSPCFAPETLAVAADFTNPNLSLDVPTSNGVFHLVGQLAATTSIAAQVEIRGGTCDGTAGAGTLTKQTDSASLPGIRLAFKVPQGGTYGGDVWVSPSTFGGCVVETRAHGIDSAGASHPVSASWAPEDPAMVLVSASEGHQVTITVRANGTSKVRVSAAGFPSKVLAIQATPFNNTMMCVLAQ